MFDTILSVLYLFCGTDKSMIQSNRHQALEFGKWNRRGSEEQKYFDQIFSSGPSSIKRKI